MRRVGAVTIGWRARAALARTDSRVTVQVPLATSLYATAGDDIVWLGAHGSSPHGRAILCDEAPNGTTGEALVVDGATATTWRPPPPPATAGEVETLLTHARGLPARAPVLGTPGGFAAAWTAPALPFPLTAAVADARALAAACAIDDAPVATRAAIDLLGAGAGLTPSGDDYVGGVFFARALLAAAVGPAPAWRAAAAAVRAAAPARTHRISAVLLADHTEGHGHAPLHELVRALADADDDRAVAAARRLVGLGHTSGWDIIAGLVAGFGFS